MQAHQLRPPHGAKHDRKRIGRGNATGQGTYAGKGLKGQKARSGNDIRIGFEGGQLPLIKRMGRKRGFTNRFRIAYQAINVERLATFPAKAEVTAESLKAAGIIRQTRSPIKVLGQGEITVALVVRADRFSEEARRKIEAAGGTANEIGPPRKEKKVRAARPTAAAPDDTAEEATDAAPSAEAPEAPTARADAEAQPEAAPPARRTRRKAAAAEEPEAEAANEEAGDAS